MFIFSILVLHLIKYQQADVLWIYLQEHIIHICLQINLYLNSKTKQHK